MKFYRCNKCGNLIVMIDDSGVNPMCCNENMQLLEPLSKDEGQEKHVPIVMIENDSVSVQIGGTIHPMQEKHHIEWIGLETSNGFYLHYIGLDEVPRTIFHLKANETAKVAYSYCNIHSLWQLEM